MIRILANAAAVLGEHLLLRCGGDGLRCGQQLADSLELFVAGEVDRELAFAFGGLAQVHFGAERGAKFLLQRLDLFVARTRNRTRVAEPRSAVLVSSETIS